MITSKIITETSNERNYFSTSNNNVVIPPNRYKCLDVFLPVFVGSVILYSAIFFLNSIRSLNRDNQAQCFRDAVGFQLIGSSVSVMTSFVLRAKNASENNRLLGSVTIGFTAGILCNIFQEIAAGKNRCGLDCFAGVITGNGYICS